MELWGAVCGIPVLSHGLPTASQQLAPLLAALTKLAGRDLPCRGVPALHPCGLQGAAGPAGG